MPIDPRIPVNIGAPSGVASRLADLERRLRLLSTRSGQTAYAGYGSVLVTWDGTTSYSLPGAVSGTGSVAGMVASCDVASNAKPIVIRVVTGSDLVIGYTYDGTIPASGTTCTIYFQWWK